MAVRPREPALAAGEELQEAPGLGRAHPGRQPRRRALARVTLGEDLVEAVLDLADRVAAEPAPLVRGVMTEATVRTFAFGTSRVNSAT